jgi:hypothetical protein
VLAIARERDIATTLAWGMVLHGWAVATLGRVDEGLAEIRSSLAGQLAAGSLIARPQFLAILADACLARGDSTRPSPPPPMASRVPQSQRTTTGTPSSSGSAPRRSMR